MADLPQSAVAGGGSGGDLPEAAERRFAEGAFTSGLSVPDFAACLQMGLEPVGYVQGFSVMQWQWSMMNRPFGGGAAYPCPHGYNFVNEQHYQGYNLEETWIEQGWSSGFGTAYRRMVEEAQKAGAHGIVGVVDTMESMGDVSVLEFRLRGTAVRVAGAPAPTAAPWTTYLAGQRLAKLIEAGYAPITLAATIASIKVWASCGTKYQMEGQGMVSGWNTDGAEVRQIADAHMSIRTMALHRIRGQLANDSLHGVTMDVRAREVGEGNQEIRCTLRGNRVRKIKQFASLPLPVPAVRLS